MAEQTRARFRIGSVRTVHEAYGVQAQAYEKLCVSMKLLKKRMESLMDSLETGLDTGKELDLMAAGLMLVAEKAIMAAGMAQRSAIDIGNNSGEIMAIHEAEEEDEE